MFLIRPVPHLLGHARVSTADQNPDLQHDVLKAAGCYRIFIDTASGALDERPALAKVLDQTSASTPKVSRC
jgi:DNA invertase Pin-like site-specific DNA recombinase